jgi:hypothetical protein
MFIFGMNFLFAYFMCIFWKFFMHKYMKIMGLLGHKNWSLEISHLVSDKINGSGCVKRWAFDIFLLI